MAISTLDGVAAGTRPLSPLLKATTGTVVAGRPVSLWALAGVPGAGSYDTTLAGVTCTGATTGAMMRGNPASGNSYVHTVAGITSAVAGALYLCDRLWHNGGFTITSTSAQTVNSATWPSRCPTSATDDTPSTNGFNVLVGLAVSATTGAATPTVTMGYTNSAGTSGRTATSILTVSSATPAGVFYPIGLQAGDVGVRSVQSLTLGSSWVSGTINLVAYRVLNIINITTGTPGVADPLATGLPRVYDDSCLFWTWVPSTGTATNIYGGYVETQG